MKNIFANKFSKKNSVSRVFVLFFSFIGLFICSLIVLGGFFFVFNVFVAFPLAAIEDIAAGPDTRPSYIFENIDELEKLTPYITEQLTDDDIEGFEPVESFVVTITWEDSEFDIYAYIFENFEQTSQYVKIKNKRSLIDETGYIGYGDLLYSTTRVVYDNERLIIIDGPSQKKTDAFYLWLQEDFTVPLK